MTRVSGYTVNATPCCGTIYGSPRYSSMNFMAWEHWTDGYRHNSLMPNDHGLRRCRCGDYFVTSEMVCVGQGDEKAGDRSLATAPYVQPKDLPQAIALAQRSEVELAARLDYWQMLNHPYRDAYRAHRQAEESAIQTEWAQRHPDRRTWWQKFRNVPEAQYKRPANSPFTFPPFQPSAQQMENMQALLVLLIPYPEPARHAEALIELHRQLRQFNEARQALKWLKYPHQRRFERVQTKLINSRHSAPVQFSF